MTFKAFNLLMVVLFLLSASVQLNDPDPMLWISVYVLAAAFSMAHAFGKLPASLTFGDLYLHWRCRRTDENRKDPYFLASKLLAQRIRHADQCMPAG